MPKVSVSVPHNRDPREIIAQARPVIEKVVQDFEGHHLDANWGDTSADFQFKSLAFTIKGSLRADDQQLAVDVDLPFAALIFKDKVERAIRKNLTRALGAPPA